MIQTQTILKAVDNSGARYVRCIKVLKGFNGNVANIGDIIVVSIQSLRLVRKVKSGEIHFGVVVRTPKEINYKDGSITKFYTSSVVLLNKKKRILGTRIFSPISKNLRRKKFIRLVLMAKNNII